MQTGCIKNKMNYKFKEIKINEVFSKISREEISKYFEHCIKIIKLNDANNKLDFSMLI